MAVRPVHIVIVSGLSPAALRMGLQDSYLEAASFLVSAGALREDCVSPFPTVAPTSVATLATGLTPREHGILGRAWYDRRKGRIHHFDPERELAAPAAPVLATRMVQSGLRFMTLGVPVGCGGTGRGVGLTDDENARMTRAVIDSGSADLTVTLLRDMDASAHEVGPGFTMPALWRADRAIGHLLDAYGSWDDALGSARWIVVGDHGFSRIFPDNPEHPLSHAVPPEALALSHRAVVVPNGRAAFSYLQGKGDRERHAAELSRLACVDQVFWRNGDWSRARLGDLEFAWETGSGARDSRGQTWRTTGSLEVFGLAELAGQLVETSYPDPLRRVNDLLKAPDAPDLVVTAREGYEFTAGRQDRGNHGSLSSADSLVPLIATGFGPLPAFTRTADVASLAAAAMDVPELVLSGAW